MEDDGFSEDDTELEEGEQPSDSSSETGSGEEPGPVRDTGREITVPGVTIGPNMQRRGEKRPMTREERRARPVVYIRASIFVERPNHRKIIIGRQGKNIKEIGIEARREIEEILEAKVFLELQVKVRLRWRDSADVLDLIEGQKET
ncbi:MAG: KH domain-containing protein [Candidatus Aminicenantes bacterium]|nr:KH domain-containing protein [Candidatus Aminicenantes bacterium]